MGRRKAKQQELWLSVTELPRTGAHPYYGKVNEVLQGIRPVKPSGRKAGEGGYWFRMREQIERETRAERRDRWRALISAAEASGESIRTFCSKQGLRESQYYYWKK